MRKILALLMAVMMMAIPAFGMAEAADTTTPNAGMPGSFIQKYLDEGQRIVLDTKAEMTDLFYEKVGLPEDVKTTVKELLDTLTFEITAQNPKGDSMAQGSFRILGKENAVGADITGAVDDSGIYIGSTFLGDKIVFISKEDIQKLVNQLQEQAMAQQTQQQQQSGLTPEQLAQLQEFIQTARKDPMAAINTLIGQPDVTGLLTALQSLAQVSDPQAVTEKPEDVPFDPAGVQIITVKKENLAKFMAEAGKVLYSMPVVRQIGGSDLTEEKLIEKLNSIPEKLAEDIEIQLYTAEDGATVMALTELKILNGEQVEPLKISALIEMMNDGMHMIITANAEKDENNAQKITLDFKLANLSENGATMDMDMSVEVKENGTAYVPMQEIYHYVWNFAEDAVSTTVDVTVRVKNNPDAQPIGIVYNMNAGMNDLGDHAEINADVTVGLEDAGEMARFTLTGKTDLAEAYIITADTVRPLESQEAMESFTKNLQTNAMGGLLKLMNVLPESVQQMLVKTINSTQAQ